ncbi:serine carboxypeptidase-like 42 [Nymphaea colorata]|nr:serine carboxypeptidase-like 42 [Nymphaea colorata]
MSVGLHGGFILLLARSLCLCLVALSAPPEHLIDRLPGQPPVGFKQYAGYINVDESAGTNFFYYFVETAHPNASSLPLALWLNGGPGCSSIGGGAFTELGPFYPHGTGNGLRLNHHSWNKLANILFLESPAGVGWSYSSKETAHEYNYNDGKVAKENVVFLLKWFERFPEYSQSQLFLTGESYAGHYIPQLASLILRHNRRVADGRESFRFNLQGILVGNPLLNYGLDTRATYSFLWSHGLISDRTYRGVLSSCDFSFGYTGESGSVGEPGKGCPFFLDAAHAEIGDSINMYDVTLDVCPPPIFHQALRLQKMMGHGAGRSEVDVCIDHEITRYLNRAAVQKSLHANLTSLPYAWEACSRIVNYKSEDQLSDMLPLLSQLLKEGVRIWIFSGDQDSVVPLTGTRLQMTRLALELRLKTKVPYRAWYAHGQVGGWYHIYEQGLVYATVRGAAHMVPYAQPERALILFKSFLHDQPLPQNS